MLEINDGSSDDDNSSYEDEHEKSGKQNLQNNTIIVRNQRSTG